MELNVAGRLPGSPQAPDRSQDHVRTQAQPQFPSQDRTQVQARVHVPAQDLAQAPVAAGDVDGPVFVDESGRRGKNLRRLGWVFGLACTCYAVMLVGSLVGGSSRAPWLGIPGPAAKEKKTETVQVTPAPTDSRAPHPGTKPGAHKGKAHPSAGASARPKATGTPKPGRTKNSAKPTGATPHPGISQSAKPTGGRSASPGLPTGPSGSPTGLSTKPTPHSGAST
ncbi:hypothetical protein [Streptomyces sp. TLI_146]|uniref:hypothetical protein n=1 Tax=Streptomyces sp. TLI_146 TaxID=1938858 RepID=UPI000C70F279|nr:hypothetical protein [Streptomyces sp. TLI_146]